MLLSPAFHVLALLLPLVHVDKLGQHFWRHGKGAVDHLGALDNISLSRFLTALNVKLSFIFVGNGKLMFKRLTAIHELLKLSPAFGDLSTGSGRATAFLCPASFVVVARVAAGVGGYTSGATSGWFGRGLWRE